MKKDKQILKEILSCIQGFRNGFYYGGRLRLVHSLVMMVLFKPININNMLSVIKMAQEHALFLGSFVFLFKASHKVFDWGIGKPLFLNKLLAGAFSGYVLNGEKTTIKYQLALYLLSRILTGLASILY